MTGGERRLRSSTTSVETARAQGSGKETSSIANTRDVSESISESPASGESHPSHANYSHGQLQVGAEQYTSLRSGHHQNAYNIAQTGHAPSLDATLMPREEQLVFGRENQNQPVHHQAGIPGYSDGNTHAGVRHPANDPPTTPSASRSDALPLPATAPAASASTTLASTHTSPLFDVPPGYRTVATSSRQSCLSISGSSIGGTATAHHQLQQNLNLGGFSSQSGPSYQSQFSHPLTVRPARFQGTSQVLQTHSHYNTHASSAFPLNVVQPTPAAAPAVAYATVQHLQDAADSGMLQPSIASPPSTSSSTSTTDSGQTTRHAKQHSDESGGMSIDPASKTSSQGYQYSLAAPVPPAAAQASISSFAGIGSHPASALPSQWNARSTSSPQLPKTGLSEHRKSRSTPLLAALQLQTPLLSDVHSRSPSASSTGMSNFGPLSASTSSSASSSLGESFLNFGITSRKSGRLTNLDRKHLCQYAENNPRTKHEEIGGKFGVERSTVSKILKQKDRWLALREDNSFPSSPTSVKKDREQPSKYRTGRHPELEAALTEWGREQTRSQTALSDDIVRKKALQLAADRKIDHTAFKASSGWLENYKDRSGYRNGKFDLDFVAPKPLPEHGHEGSQQSYEQDVRLGDSRAIALEGFASNDNKTTSTGSATTTVASSVNDNVNKTSSSSRGRDSNAASTSSILQTSGWRVSQSSRSGKPSISSLHSSSSSLPGLAEEDERASSHLAHPRNTQSHNFIVTPNTMTSDERHDHGLQNYVSSPSFTSQLSPLPSPAFSHISDAAPGLTSMSEGPWFNNTISSRQETTTMPGSSALKLLAPIQRQAQGSGYGTQLPTMKPGPSNSAEIPLMYTLDHSYSVRDGGLDQAGLSFDLSLHSRQASQHGTSYGHTDSESYRSHGIVPQAPSQHFLAGPDFSTASSGKLLLARSYTDPMPYVQRGAREGEDGALVDVTMTSDQHVAGQFADTANQDHHHSYGSLLGTLAYTEGQVASSQNLNDHDIGAGQEPRRLITSKARAEQSSQYQPVHPRRATFSNVSEISLSHSSSSGWAPTSSSSSISGHRHSLSTSAATTPIYAQFGSDAYARDGGAFEEACGALQTTVNFLKSQPESYYLATPEQRSTLDAIMHQFRTARLMNVSTLTPPKST